MVTLTIVEDVQGKNFKPSIAAADPLDLTSVLDTPNEFAFNAKPLFQLMVERKASDLFFTSNAPIKIKIEGQIFPINKQVLAPTAVRSLCFGLMSPIQLEAVPAGSGDRFRGRRGRLGALSVSISSISAATWPWCWCKGYISAGHAARG